MESKKYYKYNIPQKFNFVLENTEQIYSFFFQNKFELQILHIWI